MIPAGNIIGKLAFIGDAIHFAEFIYADRIYLLAHERRQRENVMQIARPKCAVLAPEKLIQSVGAQSRAPPRKYSGMPVALPSVVPPSPGKRGGGLADGLKVPQACIQRGNHFRRVGVVIENRKFVSTL
jgi:hypothetical protein